MKYAISQGIINLDDVRNSMKEKERQRLLSKHKYKIFQDKDGRWKTTLPDETKKNKRRLIAKSAYNDLENEIITFYATEEDKQYEKEQLITLRNVFREWLVYKSAHTNSTSYIKRIENDWNRFYDQNYISDIPINELSYLSLDVWAHNLVKNYSLTKKQYYNMRIIINQCLEYVVEKYPDIISVNPFAKVKINSKMFTKKPKPEDSTQVFNKQDEIEICQKALERYYKMPKSILGLAIVLNFNLGLRVGELVALKWGDIDAFNYIHIQRMEVKNYIIDDKGEITKDSVIVIEHVKSDAGYRKLYLNEKAREILNIIKKRNIKYGLYDGDYIFVNKFSSRLKAGKVNAFLYSLCDEINSTRKSSHKIRKTYISALFDGGLNINKIREIAGHEDERTSLKNYCFDRSLDIEVEKTLEKISS